MSKVNNNTQEYLNYRDELKRLQKSHESQLKKISTDQSNQVKDIKEAGEIELLGLRSENDQKLAQELERKNESLERMRTGLTQSQQRMSSQLEDLKKSHQTTLANENMNFQVRAQDNVVTKQETISNINDQYSKAIDDVHQTGKENLADITKNYQDQREQSTRDYNRTLASMNETNQMALSTQEKANAQNLEHQRVEYNKELNLLKKDHYYQQTSQAKDHEHKINNAKLTNDKVMQNEQKDFEKKYADLKAQHQKMLHNLEVQSNAIATKIKNELKEDINKTVTKAQNPFYTLQDIDPIIQDSEKEMAISIPLAKHEVESALLQVDKRSVKITIDRKFEENSKELGIKNKRVESITKSFDVKDILDPMKVKKSYQDGILTYIVAKM